jgi:hypothetical protein
MKSIKEGKHRQIFELFNKIIILKKIKNGNFKYIQQSISLPKRLIDFIAEFTIIIAYKNGCRNEFRQEVIL